MNNGRRWCRREKQKTAWRTRIDGTATAHDACEGDLLIHVVRRAPASPLAELACPGAVAPSSSLQYMVIRLTHDMSISVIIILHPNTSVFIYGVQFITNHIMFIYARTKETVTKRLNKGQWCLDGVRLRWYTSRLTIQLLLPAPEPGSKL